MEEISCVGNIRISDFIAIRIFIVNILRHVEMYIIITFEGSWEIVKGSNMVTPT